MFVLDVPNFKYPDYITDEAAYGGRSDLFEGQNRPTHRLTRWRAEEAGESNFPAELQGDLQIPARHWGYSPVNHPPSRAASQSYPEVAP